MKTLSEHYVQLLGLDAAWRVVDMDLSLTEQQVDHLDAVYAAELGQFDDIDAAFS